MIYEDGFILKFKDDTLALFSLLSPRTIGPIESSVTYIIREDDTLLSISEKFYNKSSYWYAIAEWNSIADPLVLVEGTPIKIPKFG